MYNEQVYQLRVFKFSMEVHLLNLFTKKLQTPCKAFNYFINVLKNWIVVLKNELTKNSDSLKKTVQTKTFTIMINVNFFLQMDQAK